MPADSFSRDRYEDDGLFHMCKSCWAPHNDRGNGIRRIAYALVGGMAKFYKLPKETRRATRRHAARLFEAGADFVTASQRTDVADGFVYVITHPAWPDFVKIGCAINPESRLKDYQTYCPMRSFRLEHYVYTDDRRAAEAAVHARFSQHRAEGEWFRVSLDEAIYALDSVASSAHFSFT